MHGYAMSKDDFEYMLDVTRFKSKADWAADPYKGVPTKVKSAFTRRESLLAQPGFHADPNLVPFCMLRINAVSAKLEVQEHQRRR